MAVLTLREALNQTELKKWKGPNVFIMGEEVACMMVPIKVTKECWQNLDQCVLTELSHFRSRNCGSGVGCNVQLASIIEMMTWNFAISKNIRSNYQSCSKNALYEWWTI